MLSRRFIGASLGLAFLAACSGGANGSSSLPSSPASSMAVGTHVADAVAVASHQRSNKRHPRAAAGPNLYIADNAANSVTVYDAHANVLRTITSGINSPRALAIGSGGDLFVANASNVTVYHGTALSPSLTITTGLNNPQRLLVDPGNGDLYVSNHNSAGGNVQVYPAGARAIPVRTYTMSITSPAGMALDNEDNLYVANTNANTVTEYNAGSTSLALTITNSVNAPTRLAVDAEDNLYVANSAGNGGKGSVGMYPNGARAIPVMMITTSINLPAELAIDANDELYVANSSTNNVEMYPSGARAIPVYKLVLTPGQNPGMLAIDPWNDVSVGATSVVWTYAAYSPGTSGASGGTTGGGESIPPSATVYGP